ncbi:hypothetical protein SDC9_37785 [bioreactor metagenome]|uniref:Peptidase S74 domain-containing protein n=1 Tax=bioreactor metagenome TaxID=1076179 RepID=A0A644VK11_9ZZZZ
MSLQDSYNNFTSSSNSLISLIEGILSEGEFTEEDKNNLNALKIGYNSSYIDVKEELQDASNIELEKKIIEISSKNSDLSQLDVFNALTNNGQAQGIFIDEETEELYINAEFLQTRGLRVVNDDNEQTLYIDEKGNLTTSGDIVGGTITGAKLQALTIDTNEVNIESQDGGMILKGALQKFTDENGKVRILIGKDTDNKFKFLLFGENGETILIDKDGIKADAIASGTIIGTHIKADTIEGTHIKGETIEGSHIQGNSISGNHIQGNVITGNHIQGKSISGDKIQGNTIEGTHIKGETIEGSNIKGNTITGTHIQGDSIGAKHIQAGSITAGSTIIANSAIGSAQISELDAGKITAGKIDTSKVEVAGTDGHLRIKGNRMQVFQGTGTQAKERVSIGDVNADGTVFGLRVRGADGTTVLLDENGIKKEGITDGSITNDKISNNADIDGSKININSVVDRINKDGTTSILGTKVKVGDGTLDVKLSNMTETQTEHGKSIGQAQTDIKANTESIKLKVDNTTYSTDKNSMTQSISKNTGSIETLQKEIKLKVESSDVTTAINDLQIGVRNLWIKNKTTGYSGIEKLSENHITGQTECYRIDSGANMVFNIEPNFSPRLYQKVTFSAWVKYSNVVQGANTWNLFNVFKHELFRKNSSTGAESSADYLTLGSFKGTSDWKRVTYTYDYSNNKNYDQLKTRLRFNLEGTLSGTAWITGIMVQLGSKETDCVLAPEDVDTIISDKVSEVKITDDKIISTVKENKTDGKNTFAQQSDITQLNNSWTAKFNDGYSQGITTINKDGITVTSSNVKSKTQMDANGFSIINTNTNRPVFKVNADGTLTLEGQMTITSGSVSDSALSTAIKNGASAGTSAKTRVDDWTYSGSTELDGNSIRTGTLSASKITTGTLDAIKVNVANMNASNITSGTISADIINADTLRGKTIIGGIVDGGILKSQKSVTGGTNKVHIEGAKIASSITSTSDIQSVEIEGNTIVLQQTYTATMGKGTKTEIDYTGVTVYNEDGTDKAVQLFSHGNVNNGNVGYFNGNVQVVKNLKVGGTITGNVSGNATTATTLQTARTINGTSFNGGGNITTANWGTARNITVGNTTKAVNGSGNVSWSTAEIGTFRAVNANGYYGLGLPDGSTSNWIRTTTNGIIPYQSGGSSSIGTSSWRFNNGYFDMIDASGGVTSTGIRSNGELVLACDNANIDYTGAIASRIRYRNSSGNYYFDPHMNNTVRLGSTTYSWNVVYAQNGVNTTSDRNFKENIKYINKNSDCFSNDDMYKFIKEDYLLAQYNYIGDEVDDEKISAIAQDLLVNTDGTDNELGQLVVNYKDAVKNNKEGENPKLSINQVQLLNIAIGALQQAMLKIEVLEKRIGEII